MQINADVLGPIADNVADCGTDINSSAQLLQEEFGSHLALDNIITYAERVSAQAQHLRDEIANPTGE